MKLMIDIDEDVYKEIIICESGESAYYFEGLIQNGTPLTDILGKIRAEILGERRKNTNMEYDKIFELCILIIDKYRESEAENEEVNRKS